MTHRRHFPSPPFRGEREGPAPEAWEGEVGHHGKRSGIPHLTPALSAPPIRFKWGGEGVASSPAPESLGESV
jgi:hypothetical protein